MTGKGPELETGGTTLSLGMLLICMVGGEGRGVMILKYMFMG
jgi:hypothetical protein